MEMLAEEDPTKYEAHFAKYIADGKDADGIEDMYAEAHKKIRADPAPKPAKKKNLKATRVDVNTIKMSDNTKHARSTKITLDERKSKVLAKIQAAQEKMMADE
jgi:large subunit ribosomal protein L5e